MVGRERNLVLYFEYDPITGQPSKAEYLDLDNKAVKTLFKSPAAGPRMEIARVSPTGKEPWLIFIDHSKAAAQPIPLPKAASFATGWAYNVDEVIAELGIPEIYLPSFSLET